MVVKHFLQNFRLQFEQILWFAFIVKHLMQISKATVSSMKKCLSMVLNLEIRLSEWLSL